MLFSLISFNFTKTLYINSNLNNNVTDFHIAGWGSLVNPQGS